MSGRDILIGDVHGCRDELSELLRAVGYRRGTDRALVVGDLVDRGPDSVGVIGLCMEGGVRALMGNHDEKHVRNARNLERHPDSRVGFRSDEERAMWSRMSGAQRDWLSSLPDVVRVGPRLVAVHAGLLPGTPYEQQPQRVYHRLRYVERRPRGDGTLAWEMARMRISDDGGFLHPRGAVYWTDVYDGPDDVVYGHNVYMNRPLITVLPGGVRTMGIDTGACFGGSLTAAVFGPPDPSGHQAVEFVYVPSAQNYHRDTFYEGEYDP